MAKIRLEDRQEYVQWSEFLQRRCMKPNEKATIKFDRYGYYWLHSSVVIDQ